MELNHIANTTKHSPNCLPFQIAAKRPAKKKCWFMNNFEVLTSLDRREISKTEKSRSNQQTRVTMDIQTSRTVNSSK